MNACPRLKLGLPPAVLPLLPRLVLNTPDVLPIDKAGLAARDRLRGIGRGYARVAREFNCPFVLDKAEEYIGACEGD
jgi:hypothetical protein